MVGGLVGEVGGVICLRGRATVILNLNIKDFENLFLGTSVCL